MIIIHIFINLSPKIDNKIFCKANMPYNKSLCMVLLISFVKKLIFQFLNI